MIVIVGEKNKVEKIKDIISNMLGKDCSDKDSDTIQFSLSSYRGVNNLLYKNPQSLLERFLQCEFDSDALYYPCNLIDLRYILRYNKISANTNLVFFTFNLIKEYFKDYKIILCIKNTDNNDLGKYCGGMYVLNSNVLELNNKDLKKILIRNSDQEMTNEVNKIVVDEQSFVDIGGINYSTVFDIKVAQKIAEVQNVSINLNDLEKNIFSFLVNVKNAFPETKNIKLLRVGGWTRDKLLGKESDDIDIAISGMTGLEFTKYIKRYDSQGITGNIFSTSLEKVKDDKLESAALEVAGINIYGQKVEFVALRTEEYNRESRVPVIKRTNNPEEDAVRRDLTINALYYNIETGQVEDYVGGLKDLKEMNIRTPVMPGKNQFESAKEIFKQDPLRILRTLRFFSRFPSAKLNDDVLAAMNDSEVHAMYKKLSPERSAKEIKKMMEGKNAVNASELLFKTGLYKLVFDVPADWKPIDMDQQNPHHNMNLLEHVVAVMRNVDKISQEMNLPDNERGLLLMSAMFHDFGKMHPEIQTPHKRNPNHMQYIGHENESAQFVSLMMKRMGFEPEEKEFVRSVVQNHMMPHGFDKLIRSKDLGRFLQKANKYYKQIMMHSRADALAKKDLPQEEYDKINQSRLEHFNKVQEYQKLMGNMYYKSILDGNKIRELVQQFINERNLKGKNLIFSDKAMVNGIHYIKFIQDLLIELQQERMVLTPELQEYAKTLPPEQGEQLLRNALTEDKAISIIKPRVIDFFLQWTKQMKNQQKEKKSINLFDIEKVKIADGGSGIGGADPNTSGYGGSEGEPAIERNEEITRKSLVYKERFRTGDKVILRDSSKGLSNPSPVIGEIIEVGETYILVKWISGIFNNKNYKDVVTRYSLSNLPLLEVSLQKIK